MVLKACRYFGHTRDYWWANLTWPLYGDICQDLAENPPTDRLVAIYFAANKWWSPPSFEGAGEGDGEPEVWECPLPDVTD